MTKEEARKIYEDWQRGVEIFDKMLKIFPVIPESFFPYSIETLEEALNIIAKDYFDVGNKRMAENIQETMAYHITGLCLSPNGVTGHKMTDEEALLSIKKRLDLIFENPELKKTSLEILHSTQKSWAKVKR
ncbi:MAG: hypothetical protein ABIK13_00105 [Patescibacteria group bacterium]